MGAGSFFQKKAAKTPEEKLRSFSEKYCSAGRMKKLILRKFNPAFYHIRASGRTIVPLSGKSEISGRDLCAIVEGALGPLSDRRGFNRENEIDKCIFELNTVQFEKLLFGARDIVRSQHFSNGRMPYEIDLVSNGGKKEMVIRMAPLLSPGTMGKLQELFTFASLAHFSFEFSRNGQGGRIAIRLPVFGNGRA